MEWIPYYFTAMNVNVTLNFNNFFWLRKFIYNPSTIQLSLIPNWKSLTEQIFFALKWQRFGCEMCYEYEIFWNPRRAFVHIWCHLVFKFSALSIFCGWQNCYSKFAYGTLGLVVLPTHFNFWLTSLTNTPAKSLKYSWIKKSC